MTKRIVFRPAAFQTLRKVYRFLGYRQGRQKRGQKDCAFLCDRLSALPYSRSVALESLPSVALSSIRATRLYHSTFPSRVVGFSL